MRKHANVQRSALHHRGVGQLIARFIRNLVRRGALLGFAVLALLPLSTTGAFALLASITSISSSANPSAFGQSVTFTATVIGVVINPTGMVTFKDGATTLGSAILNGSGQATFTTSGLAAGSHSITAEYGGDTVYDPSVSSPLTQNVTQNSTATSVSSSLNPSGFTQSVTFTATVSSAGGTPTGTVTFKDGAVTLGTSTLDGSGQATFMTGLLLPGSHSITAVYGGDANFATSTSGLLTQVVNLVPSTTTVASSVNPSALGQSVTFTATVTGLLLTPSGTVTFKDGATTLGTGALNASGQATFTTSALTSGAHSITAEYAGDLVFSGSTSAPLTQNVNANASSTTVVSSVNPSALTQPVTFTATVTSGGGTPTGTVTFKDGAVTLGTSTLDGSGQATFATSLLLPGSHSITAVYGGDANFAASTSTPLTQVVNFLATTTAVTSSANPSAPGQSVTFTATVTGLILTPTGTVTFKDGATTLGTGTLNGAGQATFTTSVFTGGNHAITAVYGGDLIYAGSTSPPLIQSVSQNSSNVTVVSSVNPSALGQTVTFTTTVTGSGATPTGIVTFKDGAATLGTGTLNGSGQAAFSTGALAAGSHTITVVYGGDGNYGTSTSAPLVQMVNQFSSNITLASSDNPSTQGQAVTFTATVTASGGTPTGTVAFKDGGTTLGTGTLNGAGQATFTTSALSIGKHAMTAVYSGDSQFSASTSPVLWQVVGVPADSVKLRGTQVVITKIEAQSSGRAISGAVDHAIANGFSDGGEMIEPGADGVWLNFAPGPRAGDRTSHAFAAFSELKDSKNGRMTYAPRQWLAWADIRGTGWNTAPSNGDISGGQVNAIAGVTRRLTPDFLVGALAGYETFNYSTLTYTGRLKGDGWTSGAYLGWRPFQDVQFSTSVSYSGVAYDGTAGTAAGSFMGSRWIVTGGVTGKYKFGQAWELEPSARAFALWENENAYNDSLGTPQPARSFMTSRTSVGSKLLYRWMATDQFAVTPYVGLYADYYVTKDDAAAIAVSPEFLQGMSARIASGLSLAETGGASLSVGGEFGGIGSEGFGNWSIRGRSSIPF